MSYKSKPQGQTSQNHSFSLHEEINGVVGRAFLSTYSKREIYDIVQAYAERMRQAYKDHNWDE